MVTIRPATLADADVLVAMGAHFLAQTEYREALAVSPTHLRGFVDRCLSGSMGGESDILVAEVGCRVVGMIGLLVAPHPFSGERVAGELFWWVEPQYRGIGVRLMRAAEQWAKDQRAVRFQMIAPNEKVGRFYRALGYAPLEQTYQRSL